MENNPPMPKISLKDTKEITCACGSTIFQEALSLREVSALITGTGKNEVLPVATIVCIKCQKPFERSSLIT